MEQIRLFNDDCLKALKELPDNSVDSVITDPPYHLTSIVKRFGKEGSAPAQFGTDGAFKRASKGFMGKEWDGGDISFRTEIWEECLRVLKPGGHLLSFSHSRTYHRMAVAIEDAGFEIRDQIMWVYGSGFPKSHNIGKAIDKLQGNDREVVGERIADDITGGNFITSKPDKMIQITKGNSPYEGWGTALKPAHEPIVMARKPFKGSVAENVLKYGTGGINIDESRIGTDDNLNGGGYSKNYTTSTFLKNGGKLEYKQPEGRFPANIIFDEEAGKILDEQSGELKPTTSRTSTKPKNATSYSLGGDANPNQLYNDKGGASKFFYCPKANKKDRNEGLEVNSSHPTVKPTKLMEYLIKLVTPKNGIVLDPFMGSGSTGKAAIKNNFAFIGIEREKEYFEIAKNRIQHQNTLNYPIQINQDEL